MENSEILDKLEKMAIFKMSLGSMELFHSNFLEFLFNIERSSFISVINHLLPKDKQLGKNDYKISREKENFDICLYHEEPKKGKEVDIVYDLILENKVKSIPYKEQLEGYKKKGNKKKGNNNNPPRYPRYLLLSLVKNIPDENEIIIDWTISYYSDLKDAIEKEYENIISSSKDNFGIYIKHYCKFIGLMDELQKGILKNFDVTSIFEKVEDFRKCRLHDLYIKLRCSNFIIQLKEKIEQRIKNGVPIQIINTKEYPKIRENGKIGIYLNQNMFNGNGQVAAFIYKKSGNNEGDIYEIVIQGNEYRHGINSIRLEDKSKEKTESQNILWHEFGGQKFLSDIPIEGDLLPQTIRKNKNSKVTKAAPFRGCGHGYIFKYKKIEDKKKNVNVNAGDLLEIMANDINDTFYS